MFYASNITIWMKFIVWNTGRVNCPSYITNTAVLNYLWLMSLCFTKCSQSRTGIIHVWSGKYFVETDYRVALTEFNLAILILLIRDGLSMCSIWYFMLRWLSIWTPKNLWIGSLYWLTIHCDWRIIYDFSLWEINKMCFPWVKLYPPSVTPS